jgi:hypothetical protein
MKSPILLLAFFVAAFSSCTTAYKTGQTPDDVYYSPAQPQDEYVQTEREERRNYRNDEYYDDRYLRMKVRNRYRWNDFNDWYSYERYGFGYGYVYGSYNNPYNSWNYYYNPYCQSNVIFNPKNTTTSYSKPRTFNLGTYNPVATNSNNKSSNLFRYTNTSNNNTYTAPRNSSNRNNSNAGNVLRDVFGGGNNSSKSTNTNSSSNSSNSSGKSSSSSSGSSAPVRRF